MRKIIALTTLVLFIGCSQVEPLKPLDTNSLAIPPQTMSVIIKGYRPQAGKVFQNLFVSNFSVKVAQGALSLSTSRDGMSDTFKTSLTSDYGFNINSPESVVPGFADLLLFNIGVTTPAQSLMYCGSNQMLSSSNDVLIYNDSRLGGTQEFLGLRDCEKVYMGLNPNLFNFAGDGIPDYLKLRCGLNPLNKNDAYLSTAGDGIANIDKCKRNIPIDENGYTEANQLFAYQYNIQANPDGTTDFVVNNIPILNGGDQNFLAFYVTETDLSNKPAAIYTAFSVIKNGYANKTLQFDYWAKDPSNSTNQEILAP